MTGKEKIMKEIVSNNESFAEFCDDNFGCPSNKGLADHCHGRGCVECWGIALVEEVE